MRAKKSLKAVVLLLAALPLLGAPCTEDKIIDYVVGIPSTIQLVASGEINRHDDEDTLDLKADLDLAAELAANDIDVMTLSPSDITIVQVFYRVYQPDPEAGREIVNAELEVSRLEDGTGNPLPGSPAILVTGWSMPAGTGNVADPTAWLDITNDVGPAGIALLNDYIADCIAEIQGGPAMVNTVIKYRVSGDSTPGAVPTDFLYEIKLQFQGIFPLEEEIPF